MKQTEKVLSAAVGFWSSILLTGVLIIYAVGMTVLVCSEPGQWQNVAVYTQQITSGWHNSLTLCHIMIFFAAPLYLVCIGCLNDHTNEKMRILTGTSMNFAIVLTVLGCMNYFIQFSMVRLSIAKGCLNGLEQFIELNPYSAIYAIVTLGWTFFFGLSSLFAAPVFRGSLLDTILRYAFIINGIFCMAGFLGYVMDITILYILYFMGMGVSMLVFSFFLTVFFRRILRT